MSEDKVRKVQRALVLQGGGALGAYDVGVFQALYKKINTGSDGRSLFDVVAGISSGLVRGLIAGKITQVTEDEQIEIMKTNLQISGQLTGLLGKPYDFYKQIDVTDFIKYLKERYSDHTAKLLLVSIP
jgi:predicted acylesterase/phospholipase RssA